MSPARLSSICTVCGVKVKSKHLIGHMERQAAGPSDSILIRLTEKWADASASEKMDMFAKMSPTARACFMVILRKVYSSDPILVQAADTYLEKFRSGEFQ